MCYLSLSLSLSVFVCLRYFETKLCMSYNYNRQSSCVCLGVPVYSTVYYKALLNEILIYLGAFLCT